MIPLRVEGLTKKYPRFTLDGVTFALEPGKITGFIGRNGAGKSTTLRSMFGLVHPDSGAVEFFGSPFHGHEAEVKQRVGFVSGAVNFYPKKKLHTISAVTASFFKNWNDAAYRDCLRRFALDENKTPHMLSAGMRVKYALTLALSHGAELLVLDEPTSGLDPVSREDLLEIFLQLSDVGKTILFSTHITSDLEKCADRILYLQNGHLRADDTLEGFVNGYRLVRAESFAPEQEKLLCGARRAKHGMTALICAADAPQFAEVSPAALEEIMVHLEKEEGA